MKNTNLELEKKDFSFICPLKISDMEKVEGGYFCGKCEKKVHDVSSFTSQEFKELQQRSANVCISFQKVAMVSLALSLSACNASHSELVGKISVKEPCQSDIKAPATHNKLSPFKVLDKNQTIKIEQPVPVRTTGEPLPVELPPKK